MRFRLTGFTVLLVGIISSAAAQAPVELFPAGGVTRGAGMEINQSAVAQLRSQEPVVKLDGVPLINGASAAFTLTPLPIFADDAEIREIGAGGNTTPIAIPDIRTWHGTDPANPDRALFVSADEKGQVRVMVTGDSTTSVTVISNVPGTTSYRMEAANLPPLDFCGAEALAVPVPEQDAEPQTAAVEPRLDLLYEIELMIDIGNNLQQKLNGDNIIIMDYLIDLFGAVNTIYRRDLAANLTIKQLNVWATKEPFSGSITDEQLFAYRDYVRANRSGSSYDLAHYFDHNPGLGGIAWLDVLGNAYPTYRFGVSNLDADGNFPANINSYYWDTMVTAHEIGHNVGSPHTHCFHPAIDCCFAEPGCTGCTESSPAAGTIMSYCHLQLFNGGSMDMVFHERCITLMKPKIAGSTRTSPYPHQPNALLEGGQRQVFIPSGSLQTTSLNGTLIEAQMVGGEPVTRNFLIRNDGTVPLVLTGAPAVSMTGSPMLGIETYPSVNTLAPGESTSFAVRFTPLIAGTYSGLITIPTNDPDTPHYRFGVSARVSQPAPPKTFKWDGATTIPDANFKGVSVNIDVSDVPGTIRDVNVEFIGADCSTPEGAAIEHPRMADLALMLESPNGTQCWLMQNPESATGANFCETTFDEEIANPDINAALSSATAPYTGTYRPFETLNRFAGQDANGTWKLTAIDVKSGNVGVLRSVSLTIIGNTSSDVEPWATYE